MHWSPEMLFLYWVQPYGQGPNYYERLYGTTPQSISRSTPTPQTKKEGLFKCCCDMILNFTKLIFQGMKT